MRWVLLAFLTLLAWVAALASAKRTKPGGRAELALTTCLLWNAILGVPIYALGLTYHLRAGPLAWASAAFSGLVLVATGWRGSLLASAADLAATVVDFLTVPFAGIAAATRARSVVTLAITFAGALCAYTAFASYFTPSWREWDSLWYHETIVGLTIQNHGFALPDIPGDLQKANGYPRFCEMLQLWFVIFTDRRLIELPNSLIGPGYMLATYVIARRYTRDVVVCLAWAAMVMLMPAASYLLQCTYIDVHVAFLILAATHYATRPTFRIVDAWLAAIAITLCIGSKYLALPPAGIALLIALVRLVWHHGFRRASLGAMAGGLAMMSGMSASIFWRNWRRFHNPLWPDLPYDNLKYNIHFPAVNFNANPLDMNMPPKDLVAALAAIPFSIPLGMKGMVYKYGFGVALIVLPLGALALVGILWLCTKDVLARAWRLPIGRSPLAYNALLVSLPMIAQLGTSPALWVSRYNLPSVAILGCLIAYWGGRPRWHAFGEGVSGAIALASLIAFWWCEPQWLWLPSDLAKLAAIPYPEREVTPAPQVSTRVDRHSGSAITREVGLEREKLKPGDIVAYYDTIQFPALLWKNDFSNLAVYTGHGPGYFDAVNAVHAKWAYCRTGDTECAPFVKAASGPTPTWRDIGVFNTENFGHMYARVER